MGEISKIEEIELSHVLMCSMRSARTQRAPISEYGPYNSAVTEMEAAGYSMRKKEGKKGGPLPSVFFGNLHHRPKFSLIRLALFTN